MKKKIIIAAAVLAIVSAAALGFYIHYGRDHYDPSKYSVEIDEGLAVGSTVGFTLPDQFDKPLTIDASTKILVVGLGRGANRDIRKFLDARPATFLSEKNGLYIANISSAPVVIRNRMILPALKKLPYSVVLLYESEVAKKLTPADAGDAIVIVSLDQTAVESISLAANSSELGQLLDVVE